MSSGTCFGGGKCSFAHSQAELRGTPDFQGTELCFQFAKRGKCSRGNRCNFAHGEDKLRRAPKDVPSTWMKETFAHPNQKVLEKTAERSEMMTLRAVQAAVEEFKMLQARLKMAEQMAFHISPAIHGFHGPPGLPPPAADSGYGSPSMRSGTQFAWSLPDEPVKIFL